MAEPFEEQVRNYFLPKLGVSDETKDLIRGIAIRLSAFESGTPEEKQDEDLRLAELRGELNKKLFTEILPDGIVTRRIPVMVFDDDDKKFKFYSHNTGSIPNISIGVSTPDKESLYPRIAEFFSRYSFFVYMGNKHAILFKKSKDQSDPGYTLLDTLDSNGVSIIDSEAFSTISVEELTLFLDISEIHGKVKFNDKVACPQIQDVYPICAFWSLISFLYFDLDIYEIIAKIQRVLEENGLPPDSKRFINAGLLAIFEKLLDTGRFLTAEEVGPGHRERGLGKCIKGGAGNKKALKEHYLKLINNSSLSQQQKDRLEEEYNIGLKELSDKAASPRNWYTLGLTKKETDVTIEKQKKQLLKRSIETMDSIAKESSDIVYNTNPINTLTKPPPPPRQPIENTSDYNLLKQHNFSREVQQFFIPRIKSEDKPFIESWYNLIIQYQKKYDLKQNHDVEVQQFLAMNRKIASRLYQDNKKKSYFYLPSISHYKYIDNNIDSVFTFMAEGKEYALSRRDNDPTIRSIVIKFLKKYPFYLYRNDVHGTFLNRNKNNPNILDFYDTNGSKFNASASNNDLIAVDYVFFYDLIEEAGLILQNKPAKCPEIQEGPNCWLWSFFININHELSIEEIIKRLNDVLIRLNIVPINEKDRKIWINAVLQAIGEKIAMEGFVPPDKALSGYRYGFGKCRKCGLKKK